MIVQGVLIWDDEEEEPWEHSASFFRVGDVEIRDAVFNTFVLGDEGTLEFGSVRITTEKDRLTIERL